MWKEEVDKMKEQQLYKILPVRIREVLKKNQIAFEELQEIRMRENQNLFLRINGENREYLHLVTKEEVREILEYITDYSPYAFEQELKNGFLTVRGGHRVGIAGKVIMEQGMVKNFQYISSVNIRVCHEIRGCADKVLPILLKNGRMEHTLILSPPGCGKTTLLRDLIRQLSDGSEFMKGTNVGVVDERSELGGCYHGVPQNHLGRRTDVLDACPKVEGMNMLVRSMTPEILAVDEIGTRADKAAIDYAVHSGVTILATAHGEKMEDVWEKGFDCFRKIIILKKAAHAGELLGIYDNRGIRLC